MKKLFAYSVLCLLTSVLCASSATPNVQFYTTDFTLNCLSTNQRVQLDPQDVASAVDPFLRRAQVTDVNGQWTWTNLPAGTYKLLCPCIPDQVISVPDDSGTLQAVNLVVGGYPAPEPSQSFLAQLSRASVFAMTNLGVLNLSNAVEGGDGLLANWQAKLGGNFSPNKAFRFEITSDPANPYSGDYSIGLMASTFLTNNGTEALYNFEGSYGLVGYADKVGSDLTQGQGVGVFGVVDGGYEIQYGVAGFAYHQIDNSTNIALAGTAVRNPLRTNLTSVGGYFEIRADWTGVDPIYQSAALLVDNRDSALDVLIARTNGLAVFKVNSVGIPISTNGYASYATLATNTIASVGFTNNTAINKTAYVTAVASSITVKNGAGTVVYISPTFLPSNTVAIALQPGGAITSTNGLSGTVVPY
jgi:hypothetical protein